MGGIAARERGTSKDNRAGWRTRNGSLGRRDDLRAMSYELTSERLTVHFRDGVQNGGGGSMLVEKGVANAVTRQPWSACQRIPGLITQPDSTPTVCIALLPSPHYFPPFVGLYNVLAIKIKTR